MRKGRLALLGIGLTVLLLVAADLTRNALRPDPAAREAAERRAAEAETTPAFGLGSVAPDFTLPDRSGREHRLSSLVRGDTLLWFICGCSHCIDLQTYLATLLRKMRGTPPSVLAVTTMPQEREDTYFRDTGLRQQLLYERKEGPVMREYRGHPCPRIYRLDSQRRIVWISLSPQVVPQIDVIGYGLAEQLGFQEPGGSDPNRPFAPSGPERLSGHKKEVEASSRNR